jgi:DNA (cytosine-5)-methyltransferase 1
MLKQEHGCQLIINGLLPTLKYYLRLIHNLEDFVQLFTQLVYDDKELKIVHKEKWTEIIKKRFS